MKQGFIAIFTLLIILNVYSQNEIDEYVILTINSSVNNKMHHDKNYYWIIKSDRISEQNFELSPLYFKDYSSTMFDNCLSKKIIDPFYSSVNEVWEFEEKYLKLQNKLLNILDNNKIKIINSKHNLKSGFKEKINIYITPIYGDFISCEMSEKCGDLISFEGDLYLPNSLVNYNKNFNIENLDIYNLYKKVNLININNQYF